MRKHTADAGRVVVIPLGAVVDVGAVVVGALVVVVVVPDPDPGIHWEYHLE